MRKIVLCIVSVFILSGCSTIDTVKRYWPRSHDPVMFQQLVNLAVAVDQQNCEQPTWAPLVVDSERLARYAEWREDPQAANLRGLRNHLENLSRGGSRSYCEIGRNLARQRISITRTAWKGR